MKRLLWAGTIGFCILSGCMNKQQSATPNSSSALIQAGLDKDLHDVAQLLNNILAKYDTSANLDLEVGEWEVHFKKGDCEFVSKVQGLRLTFRLENGVPKLSASTR